VLTVATVMFGVALTFFKIQNRLTKGGIRPTPEVELEGVDMPEMGVLAYPEFLGSSPHTTPGGNGVKQPEPALSTDGAASSGTKAMPL
jgi:hypothetical protein